MKKLGSFLTMLLIMNLLAIGGLVGYLLATGRLDKPKAEAIVDLLRHKGTPEGFRQQLYEILEPSPATASAPATQPGGAGMATAEAGMGDGGIFGASASDRLDESREVIERERMKLETEAQDLRHRQELLVKMQLDVQALENKVSDDKASYQKQVAADEAKAKDESFQKTLGLYDELKPKQIKDIFLAMPEDQVATYIEAMDPSRAGKIIAEFKSDAEQKFIMNVLDRIRGAAVSSGTGAASGTSVSSSAGAPAGL